MAINKASVYYPVHMNNSIRPHVGTIPKRILGKAVSSVELSLLTWAYISLEYREYYHIACHEQKEIYREKWNKAAN